MDEAAHPGSEPVTGTPSPRPVVHVRLLDGFEMRLPHGELAGPWTRPTARRLVQLLLLRPGRRIGREEIAEHLFPDLAPDRAANAVSKALSMAKKALSGDGVPPLLDADRNTIWIRDDVDVRIDLHDHEQRLRDALGLAPGGERDDALVRALEEAGRLLDDELYADWAIERRDALDDLRRSARIALARDRSAGHGIASPAGVMAAWMSVFESDPTSEEAAVVLMRTFVAGGRRDEAMRTYHRCRAALRRLLDSDPSPPLGAALAEAERAPIAVQPPALPPEISSIGRDGVFDDICAHLARTEGGGGPSIAVLGPAGLGKTHILAVTRARLAAAGWIVLHGASTPADALVPYGVLRTALRPIADDIPDATLLARVMGKGLRTPRPGMADVSEQQIVLAAEIAELLDAQAARSPVALVLDDVQWMDSSLASMIARLAGRAPPRRWALVIAARTDEPGAPVPDLTSSVLRVALDPLPASALTEVVRHRLGSHAERLGGTLEAIVARSAGNPLFAVELARSRVRSGDDAAVPATIMELFERRLAAATPGARALAPLVALCGEEATFEVVLRAGAALAGSESDVVEAIDDLLAAGLLTEDPTGVRLVHPLLRDAALASVNAIRRASMHSAIASTLEAIGGGGGDTTLASARHRVAAFRSARLRRHAEPAVRDGFAAADLAYEVYAEEAALELYRGALEAFESLPAPARARWREQAVAAWLRVAAILMRGYEVGAAESALMQGIALAETDQERADLWRAIGAIPYRKGDFPAAVAAYERGLASLEDRSGALAANIEVAIAWSLLRDGRTDDAAARLVGALPALEEQADIRSEFLCLDYLALALEAAGRHDDAAEVWQRAEDALRRAVGQEPGNRWERYARTFFRLHHALRPLLMSDVTTAVHELEVAVAEFVPLGDRYGTSVAHGILGSAHQVAGDLPRALEQWDAAAACLEGSGHAYHLAGMHASRAAVLRGLGRAREAAGAARLARKIAREDASPGTLAEVEEIISGAIVFLPFNRKGLELQPRPPAARHARVPAEGAARPSRSGKSSGSARS